MSAAEETVAPLDVVVIGGGVAGLTAAREFVHVGLSTLVLEASDAAGGCVRARDIAGLTIDVGAESFATRTGSVAGMLGDLGLADEIVAPNPAGSWLHLPALTGEGAVTVRSPKTSLLGIPASPLADDVRAVIGTAGSLRAYLDRVMPILTIGTAKRLGPLVEKRMGRRVLDRLVSPLSTGVYSVDADDLDVDLVAPGLNAAMTRTGSLSGAVADLRSSVTAGAAVQGLRGGMTVLVRGLLADLEHFGGELRTGARVTALEPATVGGRPGWRVLVESSSPAVPDEHRPRTSASSQSASTADSVLASASEQHEDSSIEGATGSEAEWIEARQVVLAVPSTVAIALLAAARPEWAALADLGWPEAAAVEIVSLVLDAPTLDAAPRGTGVLVASGTPGVSAKALTHASAKWGWLADRAAAAAPGRHVVRLSYGRIGAERPTSGLDDAAVADLALADASAILGVTLGAENLVASDRVVWTDAVSHAAVGQRDRVGRVRAALEQDETIAVVGAWVAGTGLASVIPDARTTAQRLRRRALHTDSGI